MRRRFIIAKLFLRGSIKKSFCSGCLCKRWKLKVYVPATGKEILKCGYCETISYT